VIGLDTSVIVRYLVGTPPDDARRAARLVDGGETLGCSIVSLIETAHVLRTQYHAPRAELIATLIEFVTRQTVTTLELPKADVLAALVMARAFADAPIPDALIAVSARSSGAIPVYTFDRAFGRLGIPVAEPWGDAPDAVRDSFA
jgi:predicted nucleic acid-binding protein